MVADTSGMLARTANNFHGSQSICGLGNSGVARLESGDPPWRPPGACRDVAHKALAAEKPAGIEPVIGQRQIVIGTRLVHRRTADLDDLQPRRGLEYLVTNLRRLERAVTGVHHEGRSLVLVHHLDPSGF